MSEASLLSDVAFWLSAVLLLVGTFFSIVGGFGLLRMPDFYARSHAGGVTDTFGAGFVLVGLMVLAGLSLNALKLAFVLAFLLITGPVSAHSLAKAAYARGVRFGEQAAEPTIEDTLGSDQDVEGEAGGGGEA